MRTAVFVLASLVPAIARAQEAPAGPPLPPTDTAPPVTTPPPEPPTPPDKPAIRITYDKGVVFSTDDDKFELKLSLRNQFRLETTRANLGNTSGEPQSHFYVPRTRLGFDGHVFTDTRYKVELALGDRGSFSFVRDVYVERPVPGSKVWIRVGQWKRPFNRQEIVSDFASELNERAITAEFVGGGRDVGVAIHDDYEKSPDGLEWALGVFNSFSGGADRPNIGTTCTDGMTGIACTTPPPTTIPIDFAPAVVARVGWNTGGIKGYSEGDLEGGPMRVAVGASYKVDLADLDGASAMSHGVEADAMIKANGLDVEAGVYLMKLAGKDAALGVLAQAGYFVAPKRAQVAARFAITDAAGDRKSIEARAAFNWYWQGHAWKWANDVGILQVTGTDPTTMATDKPDLQLRSMAQMTF